jgi:hypothetical protein
VKLKTYNRFEDLLTSRFIEEEQEWNRTIGIFPGAFKPPHRGHYLTAARACEACDVVYILMSDQPRVLGKPSKTVSGPESQKYAGLLGDGKFANEYMSGLNIRLAEVDRETSASEMRAKIADYGLGLHDNITFLDSIKEFLPDMSEEDLLAISDHLQETLKDGQITAREAELVWQRYIRSLEEKYKAIVEFDVTRGSPIRATYDLCKMLSEEADAREEIYDVLLYTGD